MFNPYEPPAESSTVEELGPERNADPTLLIRIFVATAVTSAILFAAYLPSVQDPTVILTGPVWMARITSHRLAAFGIIAFCASGVGSLIIWPRRFTGVFATAAVAVWFGTSFYVLVLTAPD